jgi:RNA polymerase sigma factor (sigma-70 family)
MNASAAAVWPAGLWRSRTWLVFFLRDAGDKPEASAAESSGARDISAESGAPVEAADQELADLTLKFRERLRLFAARRLRDRDAAEDVAQEALRRTLEALRAGRIVNREALPAFLYQTAENICLHSHRSSGRQSRAFALFGSSVAGRQADPDQLTSLIDQERRARLRQALERLEPEDRELLELVYGLELDARETGRRLGATPGAVRVRKHRAIQRLAALLGRGPAGNNVGPKGT